jgi:hypothetical protein
MLHAWRGPMTPRGPVGQPTSPAEMAGILGTVQRSLADAHVEGLSADGRFSHAYGAVLAAAKAVVRSEALRIAGPESHRDTLRVAGEMLGDEYRDIMRYFDRCRVKRNTLTYDVAGTVSEAEFEELLCHARAFSAVVLSWLLEHHPELLTGE